MKILYSLLLICSFLNVAFSQQCNINIINAVKTSPQSYVGLYNSSISNLRIFNPNGYCIRLTNCHNVTIYNCILGPSIGEGILLENCSNIVILNCSFEKNIASIYAINSTNVKINYNKFLNPYDTSQSGQHVRGQYVQFNNVTGAGNEIIGNMGECVEGNCKAEDLINIFASTGTASSPIIIKDNKFRGGAGRLNPNSSGGIMVGDGGGSNILVENNILVNPGQYGVAIASGSNIRLNNNLIYAKQTSFTNVGMYIWNQYNNFCGNNIIENNRVNWINSTGTSNPFWNGGNCANVILTNNIFGDLNLQENILSDRLVCPDIMLHYKFGGNSLFGGNTIDNSGSELHGRVIGRSRYTTSGALQFGGATLVSVPISTWLKPSSHNFTVSAWINPNSLTDIMTIACSQDGDGWNDGWRIIIDKGNLNARLITDNGIADITASGGVLLNDWNHVSFTYDGKFLRLYLNGVLRNISNASGNVKYNSSRNMTLGYSDGQNYFYKGLIGDYKFYRGVLTDNEIMNDYYTSTYKLSLNNIHSNSITTYSKSVSSNFGEKNAPTLEIFPNPTTQDNIGLALYGEKEENYQVSISNMEGKIIFLQNIKTDFYGNYKAFLAMEITLAQGIYVMKAVSENNVFVKKIIIK